MLGGVLVHGEAVLAHGEDGEEDAECGESRVQVVVEDVQWLHEQSAHPGSLQEPPL